MYVREKKIHRGEKTYTYWQLVESLWVDGRSKQHVVAHLGRLPDRLTAEVSARMAGLVCGVLDCGRQWEEEAKASPLGEERALETVRLCGAHAEDLRDEQTLTAVAYSV